MVQQVMIFLTPEGTTLRTLDPTSILGEQEVIEGYRKEGWIKVLQEYVPSARTHLTVMARRDSPLSEDIQFRLVE